MTLKPVDWNAVVVGHWNRAILTPAGIAERLLGLDEETPVEVLVPLDAIGPWKVKHNGVVVMAASDRLVIEPVELTFENLDRAKSIAAKATRALPETPLLAAGVNVKFRTTESIDALQRMTAHGSDNRLSDADFKILSRLHRRTVAWGGGQINIHVDSLPDEGYTILLNFEVKTKNADSLQSWLETPIADFKAATEKLLTEYIGVEMEGAVDD